MLRGYLALTKNNFMTGLVYRFNFIFNAFSNIFYVILIYFLWKALYQDPNRIINGMSFPQTFVYLTLASSIFHLFQTWTEWEMSSSIINGTISISLLRPLDFQFLIFFNTIGFVFSNFISITLPAITIIAVFFNSMFTLNLNLALFFVSITLAFLINFNLDYITGLISFYTESIWGISLCKEVVILFFSGAVVPLNFFPKNLRFIADLLPFQAIYNVPLTIFISKNLTLSQCFFLFANQIIWISVLFLISRIIFKHAVKTITINGG